MIHASGALWAETGRYPRFDGRVAPTCANHSRGVLNLTRDVIATSLRTYVSHYVQKDCDLHCQQPYYITGFPALHALEKPLQVTIPRPSNIAAVRQQAIMMLAMVT